MRGCEISAGGFLAVDPLSHAYQDILRTVPLLPEPTGVPFQEGK